MKTNIVIDISPTYLAEFWVSSYGPKCCQPIVLQDSLKRNIVRKKWMMKLIFCILINIEAFCKVMLSLWVSVKIAGMPKLPKISLHIIAISP